MQHNMQINATVEALSKLNSNGVELSMPELLRYKPLASMLNLTPSARAASQMSGGERSLFKGRGMEFDEARHYQAGDDIRSIDWRVTARTGKTHTKIFREERERPVFIVLDLTTSMQFGTQLLFKAVQGAHMAAFIAWASVSRGDKLGGIVFNESQDIEVKPRAQTKNALHFLNAIVNLQNTSLDGTFSDSSHGSSHGKSHSSSNNGSHSPSNEAAGAAKPASTPEAHADGANTAFLNALQRLHYIAKPGSLIHIISDCAKLKQEHFTLLGDISRHCEMKVSIVHDPFEQELPQSTSTQTLSITDGTERASIVLGDNAQSLHYQQQQARHFHSLKTSFAKMRVNPRLVSAARVLDEQLSAYKRGFEIGSAL